MPAWSNSDGRKIAHAGARPSASSFWRRFGVALEADQRHRGAMLGRRPAARIYPFVGRAQRGGGIEVGLQSDNGDNAALSDGPRGRTCRGGSGGNQRSEKEQQSVNGRSMGTIMPRSLRQKHGTGGDLKLLLGCETGRICISRSRASRFAGRFSWACWARPAVAQDLPLDQQLAAVAAPTQHVQVGQLPVMDTTPAFDAAQATETYLARVSGAARARSDAYFEGGYWLQAAGSDLRAGGGGAAAVVAHFGAHARLGGGAHPYAHRPGDALCR